MLDRHDCASVYDTEQLTEWSSLAQQAQVAAKAKDWQRANELAAKACSARPDWARNYLFHAKILSRLGCHKNEVAAILRKGLDMCTVCSDGSLLEEALRSIASPSFSSSGSADLHAVEGKGEQLPFRSKVKGLKLLPHERELIEAGELVDVTHDGSSSIWLFAESTPATDEMLTTVYRPMGDIEFAHLLAHGVLPDTQPYQTIVEGIGGRAYAEKYLRGHKSVDSSPTTVVEFVLPCALKEKLFTMQSKIEDGAISHGLGDKGGKGLPFFNSALQNGQATWRIVLVKRFTVKNIGAFGTKKQK